MNAKNRNRVPEGVPTGGQFATERRGEAPLATLASQPVGDSLTARRRAAEQAFDDNPLSLDPDHTRTTLEVARVQRDEAQQQLDEALAEWRGLPEDSDDRHTAQEKVHAASAVLTHRRQLVGSATFRHAAAGDGALEELVEQMRESTGGRFHGSFSHAEAGFSISRHDLYAHAPRIREALASARQLGVGEGSRPISMHEARKVLAKSVTARRVNLQVAPGQQAERVTFDTLKTSRGEVPVVRDESGGVLADPLTSMPWEAAGQVHQDARGNIIITEGGSHLPSVAYMPEN